VLKDGELLCKLCYPPFFKFNPYFPYFASAKMAPTMAAVKVHWIRGGRMAAAKAESMPKLVAKWGTNRAVEGENGSKFGRTKSVANL
jgi:hypothetical protein